MNSSNTHNIAKILGYLSIGLGLSEILFPGKVAKLIGIEDRHRTLMRSMGVREVVSGIGILGNKHPSGWLWSRVAGDALDLGLLILALSSKESNKTRLFTAIGSVASVAAADVVCSKELTRHLDVAHA